MIDSMHATQTVEQSHWLVGASAYHMPWPPFPVQAAGIISAPKYQRAQRLAMQKFVAYAICRYPHMRECRECAWLVLKVVAEARICRTLSDDERGLMADVGRRVFDEIEKAGETVVAP